MKKHICKALIVLSLFALLSSSFAQTSSAPRFSKPVLTNVVLDKSDIELLKSQSEKLKLAHVAKTLLAWSPLLTYMGEDKAPHAAFSIATADWDELGKAIVNVDKLVLTTLATEALMQSENGNRSPSAKLFWKAMSDFYISQVPAPPPNFLGHWKGTASSNGKTLPMDILVTQKAGHWGGLINLNDEGDDFRDTQVSGSNIKFTVGQSSTPFRFNGTISEDGYSLTGTFVSDPASGTFALKRQPR